MKRFFVNFLCALVPIKSWRKRIRSKFLGVRKPRKTYDWLGRSSYYGADFCRSHPNTKIGAFVSIGRNVSVGPGQHPIDWLSTSSFQYTLRDTIVENQQIFEHMVEPCSIGNDVWIGNNVIIKDGVTVADGVIIGSNAVVTKDVPPYAIVAGVPAKIIRYRFSEDVIKRLLELKWWDLPDDEIAKLPFKNIQACLKEIEKIRKAISVVQK